MSDKSRKVAILSFSALQQDARVLRQVEYLSQEYEVEVISYGKLPQRLAGLAKATPIRQPTSLERRARKILLLPLAKALVDGLYEQWYWGESEYQTALDLLLQSNAQAIHANDWESLPVAARAEQETGAAVVVDLHEYAPLMRENHWYWRTFYKPLVEYFLRRYKQYATASVTVGKVIAERYEAEYGLQPIVIMNAPKKSEEVGFHPTDSQRIRLIHHGAATRDRELESLIKAVAEADRRYTLDFMLVDRSHGYVAELKRLADQLAPGRVCFRQPVTPSEVTSTLADYDIGFYLLRPTNFNQMAALPNKLFDFVSAGLAFCTGPSPEMARLTRQYQFGIVADTFEPRDVARVLNALTAPEIDAMKMHALQAREVLNADVEMKKLLDLYASLLASD